MSYGLQLGANEDVYTTGSFNGTVDLNPGPDTLLAYSSTLTSYLLKLDSASNFKWAQTNGPYFRYNVYDIEANGNNLKVYGSINTFIDFDFGIDTNYYSTKGGSDYFISEYKDSPAIYTVDSVEACNQYKWIDGTTYTTDQDSTWIRLLNAQGGDSIVFLNLVLDTVHAAISKNNVTLTCHNTNVTYQWLDCDDNYAQVAGAIGKNFNPALNGNYAVQVTNVNGCRDTSDCIGVFNLSISEIESESLAVVPNPNEGVFRVESQGAEQVDFVEMYTLSGTKILSHNVLEEGAIIDATGRKGAFILRVHLLNGQERVLRVILI
jgi:hypothetical protein